MTITALIAYNRERTGRYPATPYCYDGGVDVEGTIQFIGDRQARIESDFAVMRQILLDTTKVQAEQGRTLVRIEDAVHQLQRTTDQAVRELAAAQLATNQSVQELAAAQQVTERKLQAFIDTMGRGTNGH